MVTTLALFIGHGSPMNTIERSRYTQAWRALGAQRARSRAILMVSAPMMFALTKTEHQRRRCRPTLRLLAIHATAIVAIHQSSRSRAAGARGGVGW